MNSTGAIISLLAVHSFGRVVHRNEREALLQHPATCTAILRAAKDNAQNKKRTRSSSLPRRTRSLRIASTIDIVDDPFEDSQPGPSTVKIANPFASVLDDQVVIGNQSNDNDYSSTTSILREDYARAQLVIRDIPLSPSDFDFPTSTLGTPIVPVSDIEMSRQQELYQSWILPDSAHTSYSQASEVVQKTAT